MNMKIKEGLMFREIAGETVVVPTGKAILDFRGMVTLNETGAFIWKKLDEGVKEDEIIEALKGFYEIDQETAKEDVAEFINQMEAAGFLE